MNTGELNAERTKCCLCNVTLSALMNTEPAVATLQWVIFHWITHYHVASRTRWYMSIIPKYNTCSIITGMRGAKADVRPPRRSLPCAVYILQGLVHKNHIVRTRLMYHAACKVEFQPFKRSYSQLTFFDFFIKFSFFGWIFLSEFGLEKNYRKH